MRGLVPIYLLRKLNILSHSDHCSAFQLFNIAQLFSILGYCSAFSQLFSILAQLFSIPGSTGFIVQHSATVQHSGWTVQHSARILLFSILNCSAFLATVQHSGSTVQHSGSTVQHSVSLLTARYRWTIGEHSKMRGWHLVPTFSTECWTFTIMRGWVCGTALFLSKKKLILVSLGQKHIKK